MLRLRDTLWISTILLLLTSACAPSTTDWFGMDVPEKSWNVETIEDEPHRLGAITHRSIEDCGIVLMDDEPIFVAGNPVDWDVSYQDEVIDPLRIILFTARDADGQVVLQFFDVLADFGRLAYYQVESGDDATTCINAFHELLISIDPATFPILEIPQG